MLIIPSTNPYFCSNFLHGDNVLKIFFGGDLSVDLSAGRVGFGSGWKFLLWVGRFCSMSLAELAAF